MISLKQVPKKCGTKQNIWPLRSGTNHVGPKLYSYISYTVENHADTFWYEHHIYIYVCVYVCMYVSIYLSIYRSNYLSIFLSFFLSIYIYIYTCRVSSDKSSNCSHLRLTIREAYPIPMPLLWLKTNKYSTIICTVKWLLKCHKCHQKIQDAQYIGSLGCISTIPAQKAWTKPPKPRVTHVPQIAPPSGK